MRAVALTPIVHRDAYEVDLQRALMRYLDEVLYGPIRTMLEDANVQLPWKYEGRANSWSAVVDALNSGRIRYGDGKFSGDFNAAISRELRSIGSRATTYAGVAVFELEQARLPLHVRNAVYASKEKNKALFAAILGFLTAAQLNIGQAPTGIQYAPAVDKIFADLQKQFTRTVEGAEAARAAPVPEPEPPTAETQPIEPPKPGETETTEPAPTDKPAPETPKQPGEDEELADEIADNLDHYIRKFAEQRIGEIRRKLEPHAETGNVAAIGQLYEVEYGIGKRKVVFLTKQETSVLVAKYREQKYLSLGSNRYRWRTMRDHRVRPTYDYPDGNHRVLEGQIFSWASPPISNPVTGLRAHPGEDYGCRCWAIPIIDVQ